MLNLKGVICTIVSILICLTSDIPAQDEDRCRDILEDGAYSIVRENRTTERNFVARRHIFSMTWNQFYDFKNRQIEAGGSYGPYSASFTENTTEKIFDANRSEFLEQNEKAINSREIISIFHKKGDTTIIGAWKYCMDAKEKNASKGYSASLKDHGSGQLEYTLIWRPDIFEPLRFFGKDISVVFGGEFVQSIGASESFLIQKGENWIRHIKADSDAKLVTVLLKSNYGNIVANWEYSPIPDESSGKEDTSFCRKYEKVSEEHPDSVWSTQKHMQTSGDVFNLFGGKIKLKMDNINVNTDPNQCWISVTKGESIILGFSTKDVYSNKTNTSAMYFDYRGCTFRIWTRAHPNAGENQTIGLVVEYIERSEDGS